MTAGEREIVRIITTAGKVARAGMAFTGQSHHAISAFDAHLDEWREHHERGEHMKAMAALERAAAMVPAMQAALAIYQGAVAAQTITKLGR